MNPVDFFGGCRMSLWQLNARLADPRPFLFPKCSNPAAVGICCCTAQSNSGNPMTGQGYYISEAKIVQDWQVD